MQDRKGRDVQALLYSVTFLVVRHVFDLSVCRVGELAQQPKSILRSPDSIEG